jgi:hypothetical protein
MRDVHALGEYSIKIKYFVGGFISDVGIIHIGYVPRPAAKPPSGYRASLISGYPYCASSRCPALGSGQMTASRNKPFIRGVAKDSIAIYLDTVFIDPRQGGTHHALQRSRLHGGA